MAAYVRDNSTVALLLTNAEASALYDYVATARSYDELEDGIVSRRPENVMKAKALDRATRALQAASNPAARTGARID